MSLVIFVTCENEIKFLNEFTEAESVSVVNKTKLSSSFGGVVDCLKSFGPIYQDIVKLVKEAFNFQEKDYMERIKLALVFIMKDGLTMGWKCAQIFKNFLDTN